VDDERVNADEQVQALVAGDATVKRLTTLPGIGPITATAFVAALDVASRFEHASQVASYLGLVPREYSSGDTQRRGRVLRSARIRTCSRYSCKPPGGCRARRIPARSISGRGRRQLLAGAEGRWPW